MPDKILRTVVLPLFMLALGLFSSSTAQTRAEPGKAAPPFNLVDLKTDALVSLSDMAYPGETRTGTRRGPVLLDFFRTDCDPCKKALPRLAAMYRRLKPGRVHFFVVALLEEKDGWKKLRAYFKRHKLPFPVLVDKYGNTTRDYLLSGKKGEKPEIPALFVLDREGKVRRRLVGEKDKKDYKKLERLLKKLAR